VLCQSRAERGLCLTSMGSGVMWCASGEARHLDDYCQVSPTESALVIAKSLHDLLFVVGPWVTSVYYKE